MTDAILEAFYTQNPNLRPDPTPPKAPSFYDLNVFINHANMYKLRNLVTGEVSETGPVYESYTLPKDTWEIVAWKRISWTEDQWEPKP